VQWPIGDSIDVASLLVALGMEVCGFLRFMVVLMHSDAEETREEIENHPRPRFQNLRLLDLPPEILHHAMISHK
jgi:hypothetical protein